MAKQKRDHGAGSFRERRINGIKYVEYRISINGKQHSIYRKTKKECKEVADKLIVEGIPDKPSTITVNEWFATWLENDVKVSKKESTHKNYENLYNNHLDPFLGKAKLIDIKRPKIQKLIKKKIDEGLSPRTIRLITTVLSLGFKSAILSGILKDNPVQNLSLPKAEKKEKNIIYKDDFQKILKIDTSNDILATMAKFILMTGIRRGEAVALKWDDVNFKEKTVAIVRSKNKNNITSPKTKQSIRNIPLPGIIINLLKNLKTHQKQIKKEAQKASFKYEDNGFIFTNNFGKTFHPDSVRKGLLRLLKEAGLEKTTVHELRHSFATMLLELGENIKVVQEILGHSNMQTTANIYSHVSIGLKKQAINKIDNLINNEI